MGRDRVWLWLGLQTLAIGLLLLDPLRGLLPALDHDLQLSLDARAVIPEIWREGRLVAWNPFAFSGLPALALCQIFYPPNWLFGLASPGHSLTVYLLFHFLVAAWGTFALARVLQLSPAASCLAGLVFSLSWPVFHFSNVALLGTGVWLPWVLAAAGALLLRGGAFWVGALALAHALMWLSLSAQLIYYGYLAMAGLGLALIPRLGWRTALRRGALAALALGLGLGLSALQTLPYLESSRDTLRTRGITEAVSGSFALTPASLWTALWPFAYGVPAAAQPGLQPGPLYRATVGGAQPDYHGDWLLQEVCLFAGVTTLLLAVLGATSERRGLYASLLVGLGLSVWVGMGPSAGLYRLYRLLPGASLWRAEARLSLISALALALMAALGWQVLNRGGGARASLALASAGLLMVLQQAAPGAPPGFGAFTVALALVGILVTLRGRRWGGGLVFGALILELIVMGQGYLRTAQAYQPPVPEATLRRLSEMARGHRVVTTTGPAVPGATVVWSARLGLENLEYWTSVALPHYIEMLFFNEAGRLPTLPEDIDRLVTSSHLFVLQRLSTPLMRLVGARFFLVGRADGSLTILENPQAFPRFWVASRVEVESDPARLLESLQSGRVDPRQTLLVAQSGNWPGGGQGQVQVLASSWDRATLECQLEGPAWLGSNLVWEAGWRALLDGQPAPVMRANHTFVAVPLPTGRHRLELEYQPPGFTLGCWLSGLSALACLGLLVSGFRPRAAP